MPVGPSSSIQYNAAGYNSDDNYIYAMEIGTTTLSRKAEKPGDGTWRADGVVLPLPGQWSIRVNVLISDFEIARLEGRIDIRP